MTPSSVIWPVIDGISAKVVQHWLNVSPTYSVLVQHSPSVDLMTQNSLIHGICQMTIYTSSKVEMRRIACQCYIEQYFIYAVKKYV